MLERGSKDLSNFLVVSLLEQINTNPYQINNIQGKLEDFILGYFSMNSIIYSQKQDNFEKKKSPIKNVLNYFK